jgi:bacteriocin biosynthesis cyclodehydratase domain-containing protein
MTTNVQKIDSKTVLTVPRYLGLEDIKRKKDGTYLLNLGFSRQQRKDVCLDEQGLSIIRKWLKPRTIEDVCNESGVSPSELIPTCEALLSAGVLTIHSESSNRFSRYDRHLLFFQMQGAGPEVVQERLSQARVALIGMGGIGNWVALNLIGSGLKELRLVDFDTIEETNLTRQILFSENDIGKHKVVVAKNALSGKNKNTEITAHLSQIDGETALEEILKDIDFVVLSADRPARIHDWLDSVCIHKRIPYLNIGYRDGVGIVGPMTIPGETSCYQCFKHEPDNNSTIHKEESEIALMEEFEARYQAPSFGPLNALVSAIGATEILKYLGQFGSIESHATEINIDPITFETERRHYEKDTVCKQCAHI